jgi:hypothetical protein
MKSQSSENVGKKPAGYKVAAAWLDGALSSGIKKLQGFCSELRPSFFFFFLASVKRPMHCTAKRQQRRL